MRRHNWLFALSVLAVGSLFHLTTALQPHWDEMRVKHAWNAVPPNWEHVGHPVAETMIDLYIALRPQRENALIDTLHEVSDPEHPKYGVHLSREQVAGLVAPHPNTLELINSWLEHHGVPSSSFSTSHGGGWLTITGVPVSQANALLGTSYQLYQHTETKDRILRTLGYALPAVLHAHVKTVAPTTYFGSLRQKPQKRSGGAAAPGELVKVLPSREVNHVKPSHLRWRYGTQNYVPAATGENVLGIVGYLGEYPDHDDLTTFMNTHRVDGADASFTWVHVGGGSLLDGPSSSSNLEIQYSEAIAYPTPHMYYSIVNERFLTWLDYMTSLSNIPQTISTSVSDNEQDFPRDYAWALCDLFAQLGVRGSSVIFSSGDDGVGSGECVANDGSGRVEFIPKFPASCPWITSVGGTTSLFGGTFHERDELAAPESSGGFSNYFKRPLYQENAVLSFFRDFGDRHSGLYNASSRGFPDVSAQTQSFEYVFTGRTEYHSGTGCSTPTVAAVISLLNDYRLSRNMPPLGFLNIWLYSHGWAGFNDITYGANPGCNTVGFWAIPGWDPVTGWGTPKFQNLVQMFDPPNT